MNERIKEFRFKAAEYANEQKPFGITKWNEMRDEKFAELIISECADMFPDDLSSMRDYTGKACRYMIKEHFGLTKTVEVK